MPESSNFHPYDLTKIIVVPQVEDHTDYKVWIDNEQVSNYYFEKKSSHYGYKQIKIELIKGSFKLNEKKCWALYPTHDNNSLPFLQYQFCEWFHGLDCSINKWYQAPRVLNFYHLYLQGPSFFKGMQATFNYDPVIPAEWNKTIENSLLLKRELNLCQ